MNKVVRGTQRKMVVVKTADSELFDEAYFILRKDSARYNDSSEGSMIDEANRIINKSVFSRERDRGRAAGFFARELWLYIGGLVSGSGIVGLFWLIS